MNVSLCHCEHMYTHSLHRQTHILHTPYIPAWLKVVDVVGFYPASLVAPVPSPSSLGPVEDDTAHHVGWTYHHADRNSNRPLVI